MPDVTRSDSQRSDASHKPRVSFNRDVHVKRIGREGVVSALAGDGEGHLVPLAVRRERPGRLSRRELEKEAEAILRQADRVQCTPDHGPDKFSTLPPRPRPKHSGHQSVASIFNSLDRRGKKKRAPETPESARLQRRYSNPDNVSWRSQTPQHHPTLYERPSPEVPQRRKLNRSVSDAGRRDSDSEKKILENRSSIFGTLDRLRKKKKKPPSLSEREEVVLPPVRKKKQLSPIIEMSPKVEADPFRFAAEPTPETVVYAEVVTRPSGKTTVHTAVPTDPSSRQEPQQRHHGSEEDEGVDMGHRGVQSRRFSFESDVLRPTSPKEFTVDIKRQLDVTPKRRDDDIREDKIINMLRSKSNPLLDEDVVGGYRREYRTERVIRVGGTEDPDGRGRADGMDFSTKRRLSKDLIEEIPLKSTYQNHSYDDLDRIKYHEPIRAWTPPLETTLIDSNNLSYRRDRLESRLTNQKRRFLSSANDSKSYNPKGEDLRKEFLTSQINGHGDREKGYFERKIATEIDTHHRQQLLKNKDVFADSGIEMSDYRKDSSKDVASLNRKNAETTRTIKTETTRTKSTPIVHKIDYHSDNEKRYKGDISARFIEEERRRRDVLPASSTLVKSYTKPTKNETITVTKKDEFMTKDKKKDKLSRMDKMKQLMFGIKDGKKSKTKKKDGTHEDSLRSRYTEYKGSDVSLNSSPVTQRRRQTSSSEVDDRTEQELEFYGSRQRLATPSPSLRASENKSEDTWFKSLTRRHKKSEKKHKAPMNGHTEDSLRLNQSNKTLRFFGDSDKDSLQSLRVSSPRYRDSSPSYLKQVPSQRVGRRHIIAPDSSAESTTEESNHSQKSVVYLHAATVGDIPGSRKLHKSVIGSRRSMSREELSSNQEPITPHSRTLSRSISVLAPWRPKHNRQEVNYDGGGKPPKPPKLKKLMEVKKLEPKDKNDRSKKSNRDLRRSKENLIDYKEPRRGSSESVLSDHRRSRGNLVFVGKRENYSDVEGSNFNGTSTLGRTHHTNDRSHRTNRLTDKSRDLSRSISIPKDSKVSSGWFRGKQHI